MCKTASQKLRRHKGDVQVQNQPVRSTQKCKTGLSDLPTQVRKIEIEKDCCLGITFKATPTSVFNRGVKKRRVLI